MRAGARQVAGVPERSSKAESSPQFGLQASPQSGGERKGKVEALPPPWEDSPQSFMGQAMVSSMKQ